MLKYTTRGYQSRNLKLPNFSSTAVIDLKFPPDITYYNLSWWCMFVAYSSNMDAIVNQIPSRENEVLGAWDQTKIQNFHFDSMNLRSILQWGIV